MAINLARDRPAFSFPLQPAGQLTLTVLLQPLRHVDNLSKAIKQLFDARAITCSSLQVLAPCTRHMSAAGAVMH